MFVCVCIVCVCRYLLYVYMCVYNYGGRGQPGVCVGGEEPACVLCPCSCRYVCVYCIYVSLCIDDLP